MLLKKKAQRAAREREGKRELADWGTGRGVSGEDPKDPIESSEIK